MVTQGASDVSQAALGKGRGTAKRRREQHQRSQAKHVAWLTSLIQASCSHHSGAALGQVLQRLGKLEACLAKQPVEKEAKEQQANEKVEKPSPSEDSQQLEEHHTKADTTKPVDLTELAMAAEPWLVTATAATAAAQQPAVAPAAPATAAPAETVAAATAAAEVLPMEVEEIDVVPAFHMDMVHDRLAAIEFKMWTMQVSKKQEKLLLAEIRKLKDIIKPESLGTPASRWQAKQAIDLHFGCSSSATNCRPNG